MKQAFVAVAVGGTFLVASGRFPLSPLLVAAALVAAVAAYVAATRPATAAPLAIGAIAFAPVYWGRGLGGFGVAIIPVTAAGAILLPAAVRERARFRLVALDVAVATYVVVRAASYLLNYSTGAGAAVGFGSRVAAGYVAFRLLGLVPGLRRRLAVALVAVGGLLAVLSRFEASGTNWFFGALPVGFQASAWARPELRFGSVRVEASFGHPIAFGLFLALVVALAAGLSVTSGGRRTWAFVGLGGISLLALVDTLSRGPLLVAFGAVVIWAVLERRRITGARVVVATAVVGALILFTPALIAVGALWASSSGDTREARSADYRLQVAALIADPDQFSLLGVATDVEGEISTSVSDRVGFKSLDNEYALVYVGGGALSLLAFVWVVLAAARTALAAGLDPVDRAWTVALATVSIGLLTVALLTQFADLFWIGLALTACIAQERAAPAAARKSGAAATFPGGSAPVGAPRLSRGVGV